jgi:hypothetical protein
VSRYFGRPRWYYGAYVLIPLAIAYLLGMGGGPIFGRGEGQLGALTFLGFSLIVAGVRRDKDCEVMSIPNFMFARQAHLPCLFFSLVDKLEQKSRTKA